MGLSASLLLQKLRGDSPSVKENTANESPELVPDVLVSIFALLEVTDLVRAGSVCSSWRSVYNELHSQIGHYDHLCHTPCLLYTSESDEDNVACLYSLAEKRVYKLILPDPPIRTRHIIGSSNGWLITADDMSELHLLNPITGEQIALPSVLTPQQVTPVLDSEGVLDEDALSEYEDPTSEIDDDNEVSIFTLDEFRNYLYRKAFVFPDPFRGSYIVVLIHNRGHQISFVKSEDREWTFLPLGANYHDCFYMDGTLYATTGFRAIVSFDLTGPTVTTKMIMDARMGDIANHIYIVQSPWGDILQVCRDDPIIPNNDYWDTITETGKISLYKVDMVAKKLVDIDCLSDYVLFLGRNHSQCLSAEDYPHLKANCAYFTDNYQFLFSYKDAKGDIGVLNLRNNNIEDDIVPQLYSSWPNPVWITPNLRMMSSRLI